MNQWFAERKSEFDALELCSIYKGVRGYYTNKKHWNIVTLEESNIDDETAKKCIDHLYEFVYKSLTKKNVRLWDFSMLCHIK